MISKKVKIDTNVSRNWKVLHPRNCFISYDMDTRIHIIPVKAQAWQSTAIMKSHYVVFNNRPWKKRGPVVAYGSRNRRGSSSFAYSAALCSPPFTYAALLEASEMTSESTERTPRSSLTKAICIVKSSTKVHDQIIFCRRVTWYDFIGQYC